MDVKAPNYGVEEPYVDAYDQSYAKEEPDMNSYAYDSTYDMEEPCMEPDASTYDMERLNRNINAPTYGRKKPSVDGNISTYGMREPNLNREAKGPTYDMREPYMEPGASTYGMREPNLNREAKGPTYGMREPYMEPGASTYGMREPNLNREAKGPTYGMREPNLNREAKGPTYGMREPNLNREAKGPTYGMREPYMEPGASTYGMREPNLNREAKGPTYGMREPYMEPGASTYGMREPNLNREGKDPTYGMREPYMEPGASTYGMREPNLNREAKGPTYGMREPNLNREGNGPTYGMREPNLNREGNDPTYGMREPNLNREAKGPTYGMREPNLNREAKGPTYGMRAPNLNREGNGPTYGMREPNLNREGNGPTYGMREPNLNREAKGPTYGMREPNLNREAKGPTYGMREPNLNREGDGPTYGMREPNLNREGDGPTYGMREPNLNREGNTMKESSINRDWNDPTYSMREANINRGVTVPAYGMREPNMNRDTTAPTFGIRRPYMNRYESAPTYDMREPERNMEGNTPYSRREPNMNRDGIAPTYPKNEDADTYGMMEPHMSRDVGDSSYGMEETYMDPGAETYTMDPGAETYTMEEPDMNLHSDDATSGKGKTSKLQCLQCSMCCFFAPSKLVLAQHYKTAVHKYMHAYDRKRRNLVKKCKTLSEAIAITRDDEPLLGLEYMYQYAPNQKDVVTYECRLCQGIFRFDTAYLHIVSPKHRISYLSKHHPETGIGIDFNLTSPVVCERFGQIALQVERNYGKKSINVVDTHYTQKKRVGEVDDQPLTNELSTKFDLEEWQSLGNGVDNNGSKNQGGDPPSQNYGNRSPGNMPNRFSRRNRFSQEEKPDPQGNASDKAWANPPAFSGNRNLHPEPHKGGPQLDHRATSHSDYRPGLQRPDRFGNADHQQNNREQLSYIEHRDPNYVSREQPDLQLGLNSRQDLGTASHSDHRRGLERQDGFRHAGDQHRNEKLPHNNKRDQDVKSKDRLVDERRKTSHDDRRRSSEKQDGFRNADDRRRDNDRLTRKERHQNVPSKDDRRTSSKEDYRRSSEKRDNCRNADDQRRSDERLSRNRSRDQNVSSRDQLGGDRKPDRRKASRFDQSQDSPKPDNDRTADDGRHQCNILSVTSTVPQEQGDQKSKPRKSRWDIPGDLDSQKLTRSNHPGSTAYQSDQQGKPQAEDGLPKRTQNDSSSVPGGQDLAQNKSESHILVRQDIQILDRTSINHAFLTLLFGDSPTFRELKAVHEAGFLDDVSIDEQALEEESDTEECNMDVSDDEDDGKFLFNQELFGFLNNYHITSEEDSCFVGKVTQMLTSSLRKHGQEPLKKKVSEEEAHGGEREDLRARGQQILIDLLSQMPPGWIKESGLLPS